MKKLLVLCLLPLMLMLLVCCAKAPVEAAADTDDISSLNGKKLGVMTGTIFDQMTQDLFPQSEILFFNTKSDMTTALKQGKIASYMDDEPQGRYAMAQDPELGAFSEKVADDKYGFAFSKTEKGARLRDEVNEFIKEIRADGRIKQLDEKWFSGDESNMDMPEIPKGPNGTLKMATYSGGTPFSFIFNGKIVGYEVELISLFCIEKGYSLEVSDVDFSAIIPGLVTSKYDIGGSCISITEERAKSIHFSEPNYYGGAIMIKMADNAVASEQGFFAGLKESFDRNFVEESRWKLVLSGLWVTVLISILSALFGTAIGFGLCMQRRLKNKVASSMAAVFIRIIQGLPVVVFLMILYYVIFGKSEISSVVVAVIGFSINFGAYVSEMMRTGIEAVDPGQIEAANAIGFNRVKTFTRITMPQAARHFIPVFKGEFISMVKMTSVVGYIAIQDLTKVSDIIRSRTYEAFFPLISTAIIYFLIAYFFIFLLGRLELSLDPKRRSRSLKGVTIQ